MAGDVARCAGLYEIERAVFAALGTRPPGIRRPVSAKGSDAGGITAPQLLIMTAGPAPM